MLNPERIPIGKLKQAYGLNEQDIQGLLSSLLPDEISPDTLWRNAYKSFWFGPMESYLSGYRIGTLFESSRLDFLLFPEIALQDDDYFYISKSKEQIIVLFMNLSGILISDKLQSGINYIFEETYDDAKDIFKNERELLFSTIAEEDKNYSLQFSTCENINRLLEIMDWKRHAIPHKCFAFLSTVFFDAIIVNKYASVRHLFECGYPLRREVKGISQALVERILAAPLMQPPSMIEEQPCANPAPTPSTPKPEPAPIVVHRALWEGKEPSAVVETMREKKYIDVVIAYVLFYWCDLNNKTEIGRLLIQSEKESSTYLHYTDRLLKKAAALTIIPD
jgi:hypothetical protein